MLVKVRNIPPDGMDLDFSVNENFLRTGMKKGDELFGIFRGPARCSFRLSPMEKDVYVSGAIETTLYPTCGRCGEAFEHPLRLDLSVTMSPAAAPAVRSPDSYQESEEGLLYFRNAEIRLDEVVREQILLSLPMTYLCRPACMGLCPACGTNLNAGPHACKVPPSKEA